MRRPPPGHQSNPYPILSILSNPSNIPIPILSQPKTKKKEKKDPKFPFRLHRARKQDTAYGKKKTKKEGGIGIKQRGKQTANEMKS